MKLKNEDTTLLVAALSLCRTLEINAVVVSEGMIRGCTPSMKIAMLTKTAIEVPDGTKLGISRISELDERMKIFSGPVDIDCKVNDSGDVSMLSLSGGKTKLQFRCTKASLIKYPKSNEDDAKAVITLTKAEANQLSRALKSLKAEAAVMAIDSKGGTSFEAIDATNDKFAMDLETPAYFVDEDANVVHSYEASKFASILALAVRDADKVELTIGEFGSIIMQLCGHTILIMPHITGEEDDE